jgi:predicted phage terminase large subunit-like protein
MATTVNETDNPSPFEEQEPFLWDTQRYFTYASGVGSGKTAVGLIRSALNVDLWNQGYMGAIVAPTSTMIKNAIFPLMREFGIRDKWDYNSPQSEEPGFHAPNGSRILILSADNERTIERLAGLNLAWFWVDEARDVPKRAIQILIQRLRKGDYKNGFFTSTPRKNHLEEFAFKGIDKDEGYMYGDATVYEGNDRLTITGVTPDSNPYMSPEDIQAIRDAHPGGLLQQEVEGQFVEIGGGIFDRSMMDLIPPTDVNESWNLQTIIAVDPATTVDEQRAETNDSDYWAATVAQAHPRTNTLYVTETARKRGMTLAQGCEWISQIAGQVRDAKIYCETNQAQEWLLSELKQRGVHANGVKATRNKEERILDLTIPMENGTIKFINWNHDKEENHPYQELMSELLGYPESNHDDLLDSLHRVADVAPIKLGSNILSANPYENDE